MQCTGAYAGIPRGVVEPAIGGIAAIKRFFKRTS